MNSRRTHGIRQIVVVPLIIVLVILSVRGPANSFTASDYVLGSGDVLEISVWGYPDLTRQVQIGPNGKVALPMIGTISTNGISIQQLNDLITKAYAEYIINPRILISIREFRKVHASTLGQVARPGAYEFPQGAHLLDLIAAAGGLTDAAALNKAQVLRANQPPVVIDLTRVMAGDSGLNMLLTDGTTLVVPEDLSSFVSVQGEVARPGRYRLKGEVRVLDALLMAGGLTDKASIAHASLVREANKQEPLELDALLLRQDMSRNIALQPGDVLFIPEEINNKIYVIGDVKNPGVFTMKGHLTLLQAIAMAGGPEQRGFATARAAYVVRRHGNGSQEIQAGVGRVEALPNGGQLITADLPAVMHDPSKDMSIEPGDVLVLPQSTGGGLQVITNILAGIASIFYFIK